MSPPLHGNTVRRNAIRGKHFEDYNRSAAVTYDDESSKMRDRFLSLFPSPSLSIYLSFSLSRAPRDR